jgi:hypothetical protein
MSFLSTHGESVNKNDTAAENYTNHHPTQTEILKKSKPTLRTLNIELLTSNFEVKKEKRCALPLAPLAPLLLPTFDLRLSDL